MGDFITNRIIKPTYDVDKRNVARAFSSKTDFTKDSKNRLASNRKNSLKLQ